MNLYIKNQYLFFSSIVLAIYISIFFIFGQNAYILIHDNLDSFIPWYVTLLEDGGLFNNNTTDIVMMGGASRISLGNELNIMLWLNIIFDPYYAYAINQGILRITAFIGFILLLNKYILPLEYKNYSYLIALLYSILPFYPGFGIGISGLPLITYVFLNLRNKTSNSLDWIILFIFPFYSSFVSSMLFYIILVGFVFLYDFLKKQLSRDFFLGLLIFSLLFLVINYRLIDLFIFNSDFISHRVERVSDSNGFIKSILISGKHFVLGHYHAHSLHWVFLPFVMMMLVFNLFTKNKDYIFIGLFVLNGFISLIFGFWYFEGFVSIKESYTWLNLLNLSRFSYMAPFIWYLLLALSIKNYLSFSQQKYKSKLVILIVSTSLIYSIYESDFLNEYRKNNITYEEFYSQSLFEKIDNHIGKDKKTYKVGSIGIHPSIARYNGFATIDGYLQIYSLSYKHKFRKIIEGELDKNSKLKRYYDEWGSRFYIFSSDLGKDWLNTKERNPEIDMTLNSSALYEIGARYIFSSNKISNHELNNLLFEGIFQEEGSPWEIYLYRVLKTEI